MVHMCRFLFGALTSPFFCFTRSIICCRYSTHSYRFRYLASRLHFSRDFKHPLLKLDGECRQILSVVQVGDDVVEALRVLIDVHFLIPRLWQKVSVQEYIPHVAVGDGAEQVNFKSWKSLSYS